MIATVFADAVERVIRAVIDPGNRRTFRFKAIAHPTRQVRIGVFVEIAAADASLVGDDNDRPPHLIGPEASQLENPCNELELVRPMDVPMVHIDDAITVEKKRTSIHDHRNLVGMPSTALLSKIQPHEISEGQLRGM
jgi:hypothetical protein